MFSRRRRNVYYHDLKREQSARDARFAKAAVYGGIPMAMAGLVGALAVMQPKQGIEQGYVPLEQAMGAVHGCSARSEDINGNGKLETLCDDGNGRHFEVKYGPDGEVVLELYACDVDLTRPYEKCRQGE